MNGRVASSMSGWKVWGLAAALSVGGALPGGVVRAEGPLPAAAPGPSRPAPTLTLGSGAARRVLTLAQLQALPSVTYRVRHPQLGRTSVYKGVTLRELAEVGGFGGQDLRLYASNGYLALIRAREYLNAPIMLAYEAGGRPITVLDKGPLTVVLPPEPARYQTAAYAGAWVWYVNRLTPVPSGAQNVARSGK
ncbi:hypothetical protein [Deinococcus petrolearius]|uniref:Oxidoreductase molybdopterin-binding domain-containing protein n=1 Tax=Deinococcus petrolearius TaxID=1751295 RepID=A0ABW1DNS1_9DEIO